MFSRIILSLILLAPIFCQARSLDVPVEAYGELPAKSLMAISPSATRMAYRDTSSSRDLVVVVDLKTGKLVRAGSIDGINPNDIYFVSDNIVVLIATKNVRIGGYRGRYDASWAYSFNLETGRIHALLEQGNGIYKGQTQLGRIVGLSADKKFAYMPAYHSPGSFHLYRVDLQKSRKPRIHQKGTGDTDDFFVGDNGQVLARERFDNKKNLHRIEARHDD